MYDMWSPAVQPTAFWSGLRVWLTSSPADEMEPQLAAASQLIATMDAPPEDPAVFERQLMRLASGEASERGEQVLGARAILDLWAGTKLDFSADAD